MKIGEICTLVIRLHIFYLDLTFYYTIFLADSMDKSIHIILSDEGPKFIEPSLTQRVNSNSNTYVGLNFVR